jgi:dipeptidyl-peptidase-4
VTVSIRKDGATVGEIASHAETPVIEPRPTFLALGERELRAAILWPNGEEPDHALPVLLDPYGGPHGARVLRTSANFLTSQWFADQGFAVLVLDNRGVDGRGPAWDREMRDAFDLALEDQVDGLHAAAEMFAGKLDLDRVAMRGWSFGGELSAALFEAGRFHELVLIPNASHLTRSTAVTENILRVQLDFLKRHLQP